jgi:UDP-N-acetylglucosamine:LPS N-acetylglucosamine transferase
MVRNLFLAWKVLASEKPRVVVSTGAGVCVPFFLLARLKGIKTIYIESLARINELSLTGRMVYPFADEFIVQWPGLAEKLPKARFEGQLL